MVTHIVPETVNWAHTLKSSKDQAIVLGAVASTLLAANQQAAIDLVLSQSDPKLRKEANFGLVEVGPRECGKVGR